MCFEKQVKRFLKPHIAKEDITCYKIIIFEDEQIKSQTNYYPYQLGELNKLEDDLDPHYFDETYRPAHKRPAIMIISRGFHSFRDVREEDKKNYNKEHVFDAERVVECTIPKGAEYFMNQYEYVSNQIIINKIL